tara:strand:- start:150 stop:1100 length:951 start_codon:yes stop_codon:yes gene_type:complete
MKKLNEIRIGFFGTPDFSLNFLRDLFDNDVKVQFVVSQPPRNSGRGKPLKSSPVHEWAKRNNIKVFTPTNVNDKKFMEKILDNKIDLNIVVAYGKILNEKLINLPRSLSINVHASLLPRWRGAAPIQRAILSNDKKTGVCIMKVDKKLDAGPVISEHEIKINESDNFKSVHDKIIRHGKILLRKAIINIANNDIKLKYQNDKFASYARKIDKSELKIQWNNDAKEINSKIRAFSPKPGAWTKFKNSDARIKILEASVVENLNTDCRKLNIGQITNDFKVRCAKDFLEIKILQKEGKRPISATDFLNGNKVQDLSFS